MSNNAIHLNRPEPSGQVDCFSPKSPLSSRHLFSREDHNMPNFDVAVLDSEKRAREKQASRRRDESRLHSGIVSREDFARENGFFSSLPLHSFRIAAIGGRKVDKLR